MNINLKNARRLEQSIQSMIDDMSRTTTQSVEISIHDTECNSTFNTAVQELKSTFDLTITLTDVRFQIRELISEKNQTSGLNELMAQEASLKQQLHLTLSLLNSASAVNKQSKNILAGKIVSKRENPASDRWSSNDTISINAPVEEEQLIEMKKMVAQLKRSKAKIADKCAALNLNTTLTLDPEHVTLLSELDLL